MRKFILSGRPAILTAMSSLLFWALSTSIADAQFTWNAGSGNWSVGSNWSGGSPPPPAGGPGLILTFGGAPSQWTTTNDLGAFVLNQLNLAGSWTQGSITNAAGSSWVFSGASPSINLSDSNPWTFSTGGNGLSLAANLAISVPGQGNLTFATPISGGSGLVINGNGGSNLWPTVTLSSANTFAGGVTLNAGNLVLGSATSLGLGPLTINGGVVTGGQTISNPVTLTTDLTGPSYITYTGAVNQGANPCGINLTDSTVNFQGPTHLTGPVNLVRSSLTLGGTSASIGGSIINLSSSTLVFGSANPDRIPDTAQVTAAAAIFNAGGAPIVEIVGPTQWSGLFNINLTGNGPLNFVSLQRQGLGAILVTGTTLGVSGSTGESVFAPGLAADLVGAGGATGTPTVSVLPYAIAKKSAFSVATYDSLGIRPLATTESTSTFGNASNNVSIPNGNIVVNQNVTANSLQTNIDSIHTFSGTGLIHITSGVLVDSKETVLSNNVDFGTAPALVAGGFLASGPSSALTGNLTGSGGITIVGLEVLSGNNVGLTGPLTLDGIAVIGEDINLPGTGKIYSSGNRGAGFGAAGILYSGSGPTTITRDFETDTDYLNIGSNGGGVLTISGNISGPGGVLVGGDNARPEDIYFDGINTFSGPVRVENQSTLHISSDAALGSGSFLRLFNGILELEGDWITQKTVAAPNFGVINTNGHNATIPIMTTAGTNGYMFKKTGLGSLQVGFATQNAYGTATIDQGSMSVNGPAQGAFVVGDSSVAASLAGNIGMANLTLGSNGTLSPGDNGPGTIQTGSFLWRGNGIVNIDLGPTFDHIVVSDLFSKWANFLNWPFNFNVLPGAALGTYNLIEFGRLGMGSSQFSASDFSYSGPSGLTGHFVLSANQLQFVVTSVPTQIVNPTSFQITSGMLVSGGLSQLLQIDSQYLVASPTVQHTGGWGGQVGPVQVVISGTSPTVSPSVLKIKLVGHVPSPAPNSGVGQAIELFDYTLNDYVTVDTRQASGADQTAEITASNPARFVNPLSRAIQARFTYRPTGPLFSLKWSAYIDQSVWEIAP